MATFEELGTGLFIIVLCINLFLVGFGGQAIPNNFTTFIPDGNITKTSIVNDQFGISSSSYSTPTSTQLTTNNDAFGAAVSYIVQNGFNLIRTLLVGITDFAFEAGAPQEFIIAIIIPINIIFIFFLASYIVSNTPLKGLIGG